MANPSKGCSRAKGCRLGLWGALWGSWLPLFHLVLAIPSIDGLADMVSAFECWRRQRRNRAMPFCLRSMGCTR